MASLIYSSCLYDSLRGGISFEADKFCVMLVDSSYTPDRSGHSRRKSVFGEVVGTGYKAGGSVADVKIRRVGDDIEITLGGTVWKDATITARGAVYYKRRGDKEREELIGYIDFSRDVTSTNGDFSLGPSVIRVDLPIGQ